MNDDDNKGNSGLDLGLGKLLATEESAKIPADEPRTLDVDGLIDTFIESRTSVTESEEVDSSLWQRLWRAQEYEKIASEAEKVLAGNADAVEARLWWIRAHCAQESMPISIIAAPAESLIKNHSFSEGESDAEQQELFLYTISELSESCWERDLREKSIRFLQTVIEVDSSRSPQLYSRITEERGDIDISKLPIAERSDAAIYVNFLDSLIESLLANDKSLESRKNNNQSKSESDTKSASTSLFTFFALPIKSASIPLVIVGAIVVAGYFGYQKGYDGAAPLHPPLVQGTGSGEKVTLNIPMPERKTLADGPTLWNILQTLEGVDGTNQPLKIPREPVGVTNRNNPGVVNTSLPPEPPELALLIDAYDQREGVNTRSRSPLDLDVPDSPEQAGERSSTIVQGYQSIAGIKRENASAASDNGKNEKMYLVIDKTPVFSHPSLEAPSLAELQVGNHVEVAEILGEWFKILSAKDRVGYIQSSNARPLADS